MTVPAFTVSATWPRVLITPATKAAILARTNDTAGWKTRWDSTITSAANSYKNQSAASIAGIEQVHTKMLVLALYGYLEESGRPGGGYKDKAILAASALCKISDSSVPKTARHRVLGLAWVFDLCYNDMTSGERDEIAGELVNSGGQCSRMISDPPDMMDGHSGIDQAHSIIAALAVCNHPGYDSKARAFLTKGMNFWWGATAGTGRIELERYQYVDGGMDKALGWYGYQAMWGTLYLYEALKNATTYNPFVDSTLTDMFKVWEEMLWGGLKGAPDSDYEALGDTDRVSNRPHILQRNTFTVLAQESSGTARQYFRWLYDRWDEQETPFADSCILDVLWMDREAITALSPATTNPAYVRKFDPPGLAYYRGGALGSNPWNNETSAVFRLSGRRRFRIGHEHLDAGSVQIRLGPESLLLSPSGFYDSFGSSHHYGWYQRTVGQSLAPLVLDPGQQFQRYGSTIADDGGQHYKKLIRNGALVSDPESWSNMLGEGGGLAWLRSERFVMPSTGTANVDWAIVEFREAYRKYHTDPHRLTICKTQCLFIKPTAGNGLPYPAMLFYCRIKKVNSGSRVILPMHTHGDPTLTAYGYHALGYRGVNSLTGGAKLWCDIYRPADFTITKTSLGSLDVNGWGANQFKINGTGTNWAPAEPIQNDRHKPDLGRYTVYWERVAPLGEEHFVCFMCPTLKNDSEPVSGRTWITDANYYGITLGSETFKVHKTSELLVLPGASADTTPPANVTGLTASPRDKGLMLAWTDAADADLKETIVEIRNA